MRIVAILQARMGSTRLPGKSMLPLAGKPMVTNIVERVCRATRLDAVVLAYPLADHDAMMTALDQRADDERDRPIGIYASQDPEQDLVARYLSAATAHSADLIVRICCDNPCIEPEYIDEAIRQYRLFPSVYYSNTTDAVSRGSFAEGTFHNIFVDGIGCEVFSISRLKWLDDDTRAYPVEGQREHIHRRFQDAAHGGFTLLPADIRLDVNTEADYLFIKDIYDHFGHNRFHITDVLDYLDSKT